MLRNFFKINFSKSDWIKNVKQMAEKAVIVTSDALKRSASPEIEKNHKKSKKQKKEHVVQLGKSEGFKRKIAMLVAYNGAGYYGVQVNPGFPTIESEIFPALVKVGSIPQEHADTPSKMWFQRGSRTDKGYIRTTNGFDSKNFCCNRTYMYMMPTFAYAPIEKFVSDEYRTTSEIISRVRQILQRYIGTHKFHNFTSGVKYEQASAARYIISFECSDPYISDGIEFVTLRVKGQSFMLHQIRKMIGLTIAIVRGYCNESAIDAAWQSEKVDIPIAPGLGLVLEQLHFDGYNKKWGCDGVHEPLDWSSYQEAIDDFKEKFIISDIVAKEKKDKVMIDWLRTLQFHNFNERRTEGPLKPWEQTAKMLKDMKDNPNKNVDESPMSGPQQENSTSELEVRKSLELKITVDSKDSIECGTAQEIMPNTDFAECDTSQEAMSNTDSVECVTSQEIVLSTDSVECGPLKETVPNKSESTN